MRRLIVLFLLLLNTLGTTASWTSFYCLVRIPNFMVDSLGFEVGALRGCRKWTMTFCMAMSKQRPLGQVAVCDV